MQFLRDELSKVPQSKFDAAFKGEIPPVEENKPPESAKPAEAPKPAEVAKPEEKAATEDGKLAEEGKAPGANPLDKLGPLPAEKIAKAFQDNPTLEQTLAPLGMGQEQLLANARLAAVTGQYRQHFATPEAAAYAKESAGHFYDIEERFPAIDDINKFDEFVMQTMLPLSIQLDDKGQPIKNADGTFQTDGSVSRFLKFAGDADLGFIERGAQQLLAQAGTDEEAKEYAQSLDAAVKFLNEFRNAGYRRPGAKPGEIPPEVKARMEQYEQEIARSRERDQATQQERERITEDSIFNDTLKGVEPLMRATLDRTALSGPLKAKAEKEIYAGVLNSLKDNRDYQRMKAQYWSRGAGEQVKSLVALNIGTIEGIFPSIAEKVLSEYGVELVAANAARQKTIDTQIARDQSTPSSQTASAAAAPKVMSDDDIDRQAEANVLAKHGNRRTPSFNQEFLMEVFRLKQAASGAA